MGDQPGTARQAIDTLLASGQLDLGGAGLPAAAIRHRRPGVARGAAQLL